MCTPISPSTSGEIAHADDTDADQQLLESVLPDGDRPRYAERYLKLCPDSPAAQAYMVRYDWTKVEGDGAAWEKAYRGHAVVLGELADKYESTKKTDDAIRLWQATVKIAPDNRCYLRLAGLYKNEKKDDAKSLATMKERLLHPDSGLEHAAMRVQIAYVYAQKNDFKTALSYAEKAAEDSVAE